MFLCLCRSQGSKAALRWVVRNYYRTGDTVLLIHCQPSQFNPGAGIYTHIYMYVLVLLILMYACL